MEHEQGAAARGLLVMASRSHKVSQVQGGQSGGIGERVGVSCERSMTST